MNIDLAIHSNITKDLEELDTNINLHWEKLTLLIHEREKLLLYQRVSNLKANGPIHLNQESSIVGTDRS